MNTRIISARESSAAVRLIVAAILACGAIGMLRGAQTQDGPKVNVRNVPPPGPASQGKVEGHLPSLRPAGDLKEFLTTHPAPEIWLIFARPAGQNGGPSNDQAEGLKVELPPQAIGLLQTQWKAVLLSRYKEDVEGLPDVESFTREDALIARASSDALQGLTKVTIDAPDGKRPISWREAEGLVRFVNVKSSELIAEVKEDKQ